MDKPIPTWQRRFQIAKRILSKTLFRMLGPLNRLVQPKELYAIKKGYHHARSVLDFDDTANTDQWQKEVYTYASKVFEKNNYQSVIDLGCGSAYKLVHHFDKAEITGIDTETTWEWLKKTYPSHNWLSFEKTDPSGLSADLLICADVIEHIKDPDNLLKFITRANVKIILLSTPERTAVAGKYDFGPPENPAHYREWNLEEFKNYIARDFSIQEQRIFNDQSVTQVIICKKSVS